MTTIADNSSMTVWPWWVWTALAVVGVVLIFWVEYRRDQRVKRRRAMERHPSNHTPPAEKCDSQGCRYPAATLRFLPDDIHGLTQMRFVCIGCADEGDAHGWWARKSPAITSTDIARIENYANGDVA